jgi:hypothetical protein
MEQNFKLSLAKSSHNTQNELGLLNEKGRANRGALIMENVSKTRKLETMRGNFHFS